MVDVDDVCVLCVMFHGFESDEKEYLITLSVCYQYHDFDIQCVKQFDNERPTVYKIIDTSREFINQIKTEFNLKNVF